MFVRTYTGGEMDSPRCTTRDLLRRRLPIVAWLPLYTWSKLMQDCLAGFTVGLTAIPQGIAYAVVAGLPAQVSYPSSLIIYYNDINHR